MTHRSPDFLAGLVRELTSLPAETPWVEFKHNNDNPQEIGEYLSALSNAAALDGRANAYLLWGVDDGTHEILGTTVSPTTAKKGNEPLENWLLRLLEPRILFRFDEVTVDGKRVVVLEIKSAAHRPVAFSGTEYIRVGEVKKTLKEAPELERELWRIFDTTPFEELIAAERLDGDDVLRLLDYPAYFDLLEAPLPKGPEGILSAMAEDRLIQPCSAGGWDITNLGALLFAKRLSEFRSLKRKAMRVIQYRGQGRIETLKEQEDPKGYACGFEGLIGYINGRLPSNEVIEQALRKSVPMFPELAVRELVANALIHQDLHATGTGPMVEIFDDRIEITNPGEPLVSTERFVDTPPKSRNETLASLMRRFRICEERGSGIDKVVFEVEYYQLPAPLFEVPEGFTRSVLFAHKELKEMDRKERVRACYLHACLCYVTRKEMSNTTLRGRFGVEERNRAAVSRIIREAVEDGAVVPADRGAAPKLMRYIPFWAAEA